MLLKVDDTGFGVLVIMQISELKLQMILKINKNTGCHANCCEETNSIEIFTK